MVLHKSARLVLCLLFLLALGLSFSSNPTQAQPSSRTFPETGKTVQGRFLDYWNSHGALAQQGFPISNEMQETSDTDGKTYTVQYFERAVFELHPGNKPPNDVLLSLLGNFLYQQKYPSNASNQHTSTQNPRLFPETGHNVGGKFLSYWQSHGGLAQQGYPISEEFTEVSDLDGKSYTVQYFERAVFELHPENAAPFDVLLSQLGTFRYRAKYSAAQPAPIIPTPVAGCTSNLAPGSWQGPLDWQFKLTSDSGLTGDGSLKADLTLDVACDGTFTGKAVTTQYAAQGMAAGVRVLTCTTPEKPVADFSGRVVPLPDGLHLVIPGGTWQAGIVTCTSPIGAPQTQQLTGQPVGPADVRVDTVSDGKITGSQWLSDPALAAIQEKSTPSSPMPR